MKIEKNYFTENIKSPLIFRGDDKTAYRDPAITYVGGWFHLFFVTIQDTPLTENNIGVT